MVECTFETKCWENDYRIMLDNDHIRKMIENCNYAFKTRHLIINNVNDEAHVSELAQALKDSCIIDDWFLASQYAEEAIKKFDIVDEFRGGYNYSVSEVVGILKCETKYLLHFSSDSYIPKEFGNSNWISEAIDIMENDENIVVANPTWNKHGLHIGNKYNWDEAEHESFKRIGNFYLGQGFSDQCYLINTNVFKNKIYNFTHPDSERYPKYGGELFEKKCDAFMRTNNKYRITSTTTGYVSNNIKKSQYLVEKLGLKRDL